MSKTPIEWKYEGLPAYRFAWVVSAEMVDLFPLPQRLDQIEITADGTMKALCWDLITSEHNGQRWFRRDNFRWEALPYTGRLELRLRILPGESSVERFVWLDYQNGKLIQAQEVGQCVVPRFSREIAHLAEQPPEA